MIVLVNPYLSERITAIRLTLSQDSKNSPICEKYQARQSSLLVRLWVWEKLYHGQVLQQYTHTL